jgi:hypothetical protein
VARKTRRVSCQFPVLWAVDNTPQHPANLQNNSWTLVQVCKQLAVGCFRS